MPELDVMTFIVSLTSNPIIKSASLHKNDDGWYAEIKSDFDQVTTVTKPTIFEVIDVIKEWIRMYATPTRAELINKLANYDSLLELAK
jgi:hypothetical protein